MGAVVNSYRGKTDKIYEIVNAFSKGYNTNVADDVLDESYFRDLVNYMPSEEGNITKRPGITKIGLNQMFSNLMSGKSGVTYTVGGSTNMPGATGLTTLDYIYGKLFQLNETTYTRTDTIEGESKSVSVEYTPKSLLYFTILDDENDIIYSVKDFTSSITDDTWFTNNYKISFLFIFNGIYTETYDNTKSQLNTNGVRIVKLQLEYKVENGTNNLDISYEIREPYRANNTDRLVYRYAGDEVLDPAIYIDNFYYMNGYDAITKITRNVSNSTTIVSDSIMEYYTDCDGLYTPTAIDVKNIGFNIMYSKPTDHIDNTGTANAIRGVFYMYDGEPTQSVPYNKTFEIHILSSGSGENKTPKYRPNNGEVSTDTNPYTDMPGSYNSDKSIFTCTGLNETQALEFKIQKGDDSASDKVTYITYETPTNVSTQELGKIEDVAKLLFKSRYCKVINSQLVLYGNHGYMFFSDVDDFKYFPNYYYIYMAETENEEVVSLNYFRQYYAVFTNKRIKRMTGTFNSDDFGVYPLNDYIGCINPRSIKQVENYLYFLSYNGLYILKQGYLGEGTENVEQIDLPIYKSYTTDNMLKSAVFMNYYGLYSDDEAILYNYALKAFYKFKTSTTIARQSKTNTLYARTNQSGLFPGDNVYPGDTIFPYTEETTTEILYNGEVLNVNTKSSKKRVLEYSLPFQYHKLQADLFYGVVEDVEGDVDFDMCIQDYAETNYVATDNDITFETSFETPMMSFDSPTNIKKFKAIYLKMYTKNGKSVPLYVTVIVDDQVVVSPKQYIVQYDEDTSTWEYVEKTDKNKYLYGEEIIGQVGKNNIKLKGYNVLGTMTLGEDILGMRTMQVLKMKVGYKGRGIKIIVSDSDDEVTEEEQGALNKNKYDIGTIGVVYKLKKVKEG